MLGRTWWMVGSLVVAVAALAPVGCGAADDGDGLNGNGGTAAAAASTGTAASGNVGGMGFDAGEGDGSLADGEVCEGTTETATLLPLHMIIVVDRSGSMDYFGYWQPTVNALTAFVTDPLSDGLYVGLNYFPSPQGGDSCSLGLWNPLQVPNGAPPLALLPGEANVLTSSLASVGTGNLTPMWGALEGSYQVAQALQAQNPNDKVIVVLASDGLPTLCGNYQEDIGNIANDLVATAYNNGNGIDTYTVAIDQAVVAPMNTIAAAGGTQQTYDVSQDITQFAQTMADIRGSALGCEYLIPESTEEFDPFKVNLIFTPSGGGTPETIPQAANEAACGNQDGWYYDDPVNPTMIILCPALCQRVENDQEASVEVKFGCPTSTR